MPFRLIAGIESARGAIESIASPRPACNLFYLKIIAQVIACIDVRSHFFLVQKAHKNHENVHFLHFFFDTGLTNDYICLGQLEFFMQSACRKLKGSI
jgi:hypothetical protein